MPRGSGRRPKPTALKKLHGNPGKRTLKAGEPIAPPGDPEMPKGLPKAAADEWKRILPELRTLGVLSKIDRAALAAYCHAFARWFDAEKDIKRFGRLIREPILVRVDGDVEESGYEKLKKNPAISISEKAMALMKAFLVEFGMTPASRSRLAVAVGGYEPVKREPRADPAEKYFGSGQTIQ